MCGILALLLASDSSTSTFDILLQGLRALQNRGYDSCGIMDSKFKCLLRTVKGSEMNGEFDTSLPDDAVDQLALLKDKFPEDSLVGIAHTRWATHGAKTIPNAHPHISSDKAVSVIHNGVIENCDELRQQLHGFTFSSETDTEVIANWLAWKLQQEPITADSVIQAMRAGQKVFQGSWAIAVMVKEIPDTIFLGKHGSPLLIGHNDGLLMATSEVAGFVNNVTKYAVLSEDDIIQLHKEMTPQDLHNLYPNLEFLDLPQEKILFTPNPYPHWMAKELYDQVDAVKGPGNWGENMDIMLNNIPEFREVANLRQKLQQDGDFDILLVGCGTSYHAGLSGRWFFESVPFRTVRVVVASEFTKQDLPKGKSGTPRNVLAIMISQSGETKDVHRALGIIKKAGIATIALVNVPQSMIARDCDIAVHLHAGREVAVASTKAFVSQIVGLRLIAQSLSGGSSIPPDCFCLSDQIRSTLYNIFPSEEGKILRYPCSKKIRVIAEALHQKNHGFVLSTGTLRAVAYEAALKIKEISRVWIQGYPTGALKHGPFSLIEKGTPVLFSLQDNDVDVRKRTETAVEEVYARKARVFIITDISGYENRHAEVIIHVPRNEILAPILNIIPFQVLAYQLSLMRNLDPDKPIHLAKVVTTD